jgi:hypothetical protein
MGSVCDKSFCIVTGCRFLVQRCKTYSCDSVVNIATNYGTEVQGANPGGARDFSVFRNVYTSSGGPHCPKMDTIKFHYWKYAGTEDRTYFRRGPHDGHPYSVACSHTWLSRPRGFIALKGRVTRMQWVLTQQGSVKKYLSVLFSTPFWISPCLLSSRLDEGTHSVVEPTD